jgi:hypothetical protein
MMTHSFPVEQTAIDAGKILTWTKGFAAKNAIGNDVVKLLQDALDRKHIHVRVSALVNDVSARCMWDRALAYYQRVQKLVLILWCTVDRRYPALAIISERPRPDRRHLRYRYKRGVH